MKKKITRWVNVYTDGTVGSLIYDSDVDAKEGFDPHYEYFTTVELTGEYDAPEEKIEITRDQLQRAWAVEFKKSKRPDYNPADSFANLAKELGFKE